MDVSDHLFIMHVFIGYLVNYYHRYIGDKISYMYSTSYATWMCVTTFLSSMSISAILLTTTIGTSVIGSGTCIALVTPHGCV